MEQQSYRFVIIGGGLSGMSAADGIRELDSDGTILIIGRETDLPYERPPLTKGLWLGKKTLSQVFPHPEEYYADKRIELLRGQTVKTLDPQAHVVTNEAGEGFHYERLLLATGGQPRRLSIPGADMPGINYYRYLPDYRALCAQTKVGAAVTIVGGGFIGSELAAALCANDLKVSIVFPEAYPVSRVFPPALGMALLKKFREKGISVYAGDVPTRIEKAGERFLTHTKGGLALEK